MDSAEVDLNNTILSSTSISDDYEKNLRLAAELGRCLLERNQELENYIHILQKQIDDKQCDIKLLHAKLLTTREQLDAKCKQTELLDATNFDLEQELVIQRRENEKNRQQIKDLFDLYEKTRKQYQDIEYEYETFRNKQFSSYFLSKQINLSNQTPNISTPVSTKRQRSNSYSIISISDSPLLNLSSNLFDTSSTSVFKSHLSELKSRIHSLTNEYSLLNEQYHRSEEEKTYLINCLTKLERQYRDDNDSYQNEINSYQKLIEKYHHDNNNNKIILSNIYSPESEHNISLYDEVLLENKQFKSSYQPTNYRELFACVYEKLKTKK